MPCTILRVVSVGRGSYVLLGQKEAETVDLADISLIVCNMADKFFARLATPASVRDPALVDGSPLPVILA